MKHTCCQMQSMKIEEIVFWLLSREIRFVYSWMLITRVDWWRLWIFSCDILCQNFTPIKWKVCYLSALSLQLSTSERFFSFHRMDARIFFFFASAVTYMFEHSHVAEFYISRSCTAKAICNQKRARTRRSPMELHTSEGKLILQ